MAGTKAGGAKTAVTNKAKYGDDFYKKLGKEGGMHRHPSKGFGSDKKRASEAGKKGGEISRRGPSKNITHIDPIDNHSSWFSRTNERLGKVYGKDGR